MRSQVYVWSDKGLHYHLRRYWYSIKSLNSFLLSYDVCKLHLTRALFTVRRMPDGSQIYYEAKNPLKALLCVRISIHRSTIKSRNCMQISLEFFQWIKRRLRQRDLCFLQRRGGIHSLIEELKVLMGILQNSPINLTEMLSNIN